MKRFLLFCLISALAAMTGVFADTPELTFNADGKFKILQLTDMHYIEGEAKSDVAIENIHTLINAENPDLVIITGDIVLVRNQAQGFRNLLGAIAEHNVPFAFTLGNHELEGPITGKEIIEVAKTIPGNLTDTTEGVSRTTNCYLTIKSPRNGRNMAALYLLDSGDYLSHIEGISGYDVVKFDQIAWYRSVSAQLTRENRGRPLPSLAFFHIPVPEFKMARERGGITGTQGENECVPEINTGLWASMREMGDILGMFCGHDHNNDYCVDYKGILLAYGRFSGCNTIYNNLGLKGGRVIELNEGSRSFTTWIRLTDGSKINSKGYTAPDAPTFKYDDEEGKFDTWYVDGVNGSDVNYGSEDAPLATLEAAFKACNVNDVISVRGPLKVNKTITLAKGMTNITVVGEGELDENIITAGCPIMSGAGCEITFRNITFANIEHKDNVGLIFNFSESSQLTIDGCAFRNNKSTTTKGKGLIYGLSTQLNIKNSVFEGNTVDYGVIWGNQLISVTGCKFINNTGGTSGGASIYVEGANGNIVCNDCEFVGNNSPKRGIVYNRGCDSEFTDCSFRNNTSKSGGGAFEIRYTARESNVTFDRCSFVNNTGAQGAILCHVTSAPTVKVYNSTFYGNVATEAGGAIEMHTTKGGILELVNCTVTGNTNQASYTTGGGVYLSSCARLNVYNSIIEGNRAKDDTGVRWNDITVNTDNVTSDCAMRVSLNASVVGWITSPKAEWGAHKPDGKVASELNFYDANPSAWVNYAGLGNFVAEGGYIPFASDNAPGLSFGKISLIPSNRRVDQLGNERTLNAIGAVEAVAESGAVDAVNVDAADAPAEYFDLQGRRVANPGNGIYLRRQGAAVTKITR